MSTCQEEHHHHHHRHPYDEKEEEKWKLNFYSLYYQNGRKTEWNGMEKGGK